jgi:hypothetical protein
MMNNGVPRFVERNGFVIVHRGDGRRFVVRSDEKLTAFVELESAIRGSPNFTHPCTVKRHIAGTETYD